MKKKICLFTVLAMLLMPVMCLFTAFDSRAAKPLTEHYRIVDKSEIKTLSESEKDTLTSELKEAYEASGYAVYIWISSDHGMNSGYEEYMQKIADRITDSDKILLYFSMQEGEHVVCIDSWDADKKGASYFLNSDRLTKIKESLIDDLSAEDYYMACHRYVEGVKKYSAKDPKFDGLLFKWYAHLIIAVVLAVIIVLSQIGSMGGVMEVNERTYLNTKKSKTLGRFDRLTHTTTQVIHHERSSSGGGGGGGGGGHSSSGGSSF